VHSVPVPAGSASILVDIVGGRSFSTVKLTSQLTISQHNLGAGHENYHILYWPPSGHWSYIAEAST